MSGGGRGDTESKTVAEPWSGAQPYVAGLDQMVGGQMYQPQQFFPGQTYAARDWNTSQGMERMKNFYNQQYQPAYNQGLNTISELQNLQNVAQNPYVNNMLDTQKNLANENLRENLLPQIASGAGRAGGFGSKYALAQGQAVGDTNRSILDSARATQLSAWNTGVNAAGNAVNMLPQYLEAGKNPAQAYMNIGAMNEDLAQKGIDQSMAKWDFNQNEPWRRMANANAILMGQNNITNTSTPVMTNPWATGAAAASGLYGLYNQFV
jgi:hypothetical protein